jgi:hypoxanthine phosphoribosyltransferase
MTGTEYFFTDYNWIERKVYAHAAELKALGITDIVGISRGGIFTAFLAAQILDINGIHLLNYDRRTRKAELQPCREIAQDAVVLLCEDVAGDGHTLADCMGALKGKVETIHTLVVSHFNRSTVTPDFGYYSEKICVFPWERHRINAQSHRDHKSGGPIKADSDYFIYGADMDGIFLPDIPDLQYQQNLAAALIERAELMPYDASLFPTGFGEDWIIVSGRPSIDISVTQDWLRKHNISCRKVLLRDEAAIDFPAHVDHYVKSEKSAQSKIVHILAQGITHFYESDPLQAIIIAAEAPFVRVCWWNTHWQIRKWITADSIA